MNDPGTDQPRDPAASARRVEYVSELLLVAALCWLFFFFGLSTFGLVGADEPRYAQVAREMLDRGDWITPVLYGEPWLEKPIGYYWGAIIGYKLFGVNDWGARFPGAAAGTLMTVFLYFWLRRFRPGTQLDGVAIAVTTAFVIGFSRGASMDIQLTAPFAVGMLSWWGWYETRRRAWLALFYACIAIGTLAKGPVAAFLAGLLILIFAALRRDLRLVLRTLWVPGILIYLAIALPWYVAVQHATPQFFREFILQHNLDRFATNRYFHQQPFWYYVPVVLAGLVPWTVFAVAAVVDQVRKLRRAHELTETQSLGTFLAIWALVPIVFFSASHSKLPGYILPCIPPFAVMTALYLRERKNAGVRPPAWVAALHALLPAGLMAAVIVAPSVMLRIRPASQTITAAFVAGLLVAAAVLFVVQRGGYGLVRRATVAPIALALVFLVRLGGPLADATQSMRPLAAEIRSSRLHDAPIVTFDTPRQVEYGLAYYLNRPLGGPALQEFSAEHPNAFPQCGSYLVVTKRGSGGALEAIAGGSAVIEPLRRTSRSPIPWELHSLTQHCPSAEPK